MRKHYIKNSCNLLFSLLFSLCFFQGISQESQSNSIKGIKVFEQSQIQSKSQTTARLSPQVFREEFRLTNENNFVLLSNESDDYGFVHERYQQYYKGIKVEFGNASLHYKKGKLNSMSYNVYPFEDIDVSAKLSNIKAFDKAIAFVGAVKYLWQDPDQAALFDWYAKPTGELVIFPDINDTKKDPVTAYKFDIYAIDPVYRAEIYVNAKTGAILFENQRIHMVNVPASGESFYNGQVSFTADEQSGSFRLRQTTHGNGINTYDMQNGTNYHGAIDFTSNSSSFSSSEAKGVQVHWSTEQTYNYYLQKHGRNSYDNAGGELNSYVSYGNNYPNAFFNGRGMTYGDGSGNINPRGTLDVVAHEITHGVTQHSAGLTSGGETGALKESFSDIFGEAVEKETTGTNDWRIGGGRSLSNPNQSGDPDTYKGNYWKSTSDCTGFACGIHSNAGVQNHWFYLLSVGGSGTNDIGNSFTVNAIGMDKAASIAYRNLTVYLTNTSNYLAARLGAIQSAIDIYGEGSAEEIAVTNAWYAVGVGHEYLSKVNINAGGPTANYNGQDFTADQYFNQGSILSRPQTGLPEPYSTFRYSRSQVMNYDIPLKNGEYNVKLHFAELWFGATGGGSGGVGSRIFDVRLEDELVEDDLDVFAEVGAESILLKTYKVNIVDGVLNINFSSLESDGGVRHPIINAIEIKSNAESEAITSFITSWKTDNEGSSSNNQITIPKSGTGVYDIDWGDGTTSKDVSYDITHSYSVQDYYQVKILGDFKTIPFGNSGDRKKLISVDNWGDAKWTTMANAFDNCSNMDVLATDVPNLEDVTSMVNLFNNCNSLKGNAFINDWDVSNVVDMRGLFSSATSFNQPLGNWNVGNVTNMKGAFNSASAFNQDIGNWNVGSVTDMSEMFFGATSFNQPTGNWDVGNVIAMYFMFTGAESFNQPIANWNVGHVTSLHNMFALAKSFNQPIDGWNVSNVLYIDAMFNAATSFNQPLANWDVSRVTGMQDTFLGATSFDQDLSDWNIGGRGVDMGSMFDNSGLSVQSYDKILIGWSNKTDLQPNLNLGASGVLYCEGESARQKLIDDFGWTITDYGIANSCEKPTDYALRLNAGGSEVDFNGDNFIRDAYFDTGNTLNRPQTGLPEPYQSFRYSHSQQMTYDIPLEDGEYTVNLYFAELWFGATDGGSGGIGSRVFDVNIEGQLAEDNLDVFAEVGAEAILVKTHMVTITDGELNIDFDSRNAVGGKRHPIINAIEVLGEEVEEVKKPFIFSFVPRFGFGDDGLTLTIPIDSQYRYNYRVDWGDGTINDDVIGEISHIYELGNIAYVVEISGDFPRPLLDLDSSSCNNSVFAILQWGDQKWQNLESAFANTKLSLEANDIPDLSECSTIRNIFKNSGMFGSGMALIPQWDISGFTDLSGLFHGTAFNEDISGWDVSQVTDMSYMFSSGTLGCGDSPGSLGGNFNQDISSWNVSNVENMEGMFNGSSFNQDISSWNVSRVTNMRAMFAGTKFNKDISNWDVSQVTEMAYMFSGTNYNEIGSNNGGNFNQPLNDWNVSNVTDMNNMFGSASTFNQYIGDWDVSNVTNMARMFFAARNFNQDIGDWNVSNVTDMNAMFSDGSIYQNSDPYTFNQDIGDWDVSNVTSMVNMFHDSGLSNQNYDKNLIGWSQLPALQNGVRLDAPQNQYCETEEARQHIINTYGWTINDAGQNEDCIDTTLLITTWKTDNPGISEDNQIAIPTYPGETYNYTVDWGDGTSDSSVTGDITHTYVTPGVYKVSISGHFSRIYFNEAGDRLKIISVDNWGDVSWSSMDSSFAGCGFLNILAEDQPDLTNVTSMSKAFKNCSLDNSSTSIQNWNVSSIDDMSYIFQNSFLNQPLNEWNVQNVVNMSNMFSFSTYDNDISTWDVSNVTNMKNMFTFSDFKGDVGDWDVGNVLDFSGMFLATAFNFDIGGWNVANATDMSYMFDNGRKFDQNLESWNISKVRNMTGMFNESALSTENYDKTLIGWSQLSILQMQVELNANTTMYCQSEAARQKLIDDFGWTIYDAGKSEDCSVIKFRPFITTWKTDDPGISDDNQITIPTNPSESYNYNVDWGDGTTSENVGGNITHTYTQPGTYMVSITGQFPAIYLNDELDVFKFVNVEQWGDIEWGTMKSAFYSARFAMVNATDIPDLSGVEDMSSMFFTCLDLEEVPNIDQWDVSNVRDMRILFKSARKFNEDIGPWDVSNVDEMQEMFNGAKVFNQNIGSWDVSNVTNMTEMFKLASQFNSDIGDWDVGNVKTLRGTFAGAGSFNQDLSEWDVSKVENMFATFNLASTFNQDLGKWDIRNVTNLGYFLNNTAMSTNNYDKTLISWSQLPALQNGVRLDAEQNQYCNAEQARQQIIDSNGWVINDKGKAVGCEVQGRPFITTWKTDNPGISDDNQISIPANIPSETYDYYVDWGDGSTTQNVTGEITHTYETPGTYSISISGDFPRIYFDDPTLNGTNKDSQKILSIDQWGDIEWRSMKNAFRGCTNMDVVAIDVPNLFNAESMTQMFADCWALKGTTKFKDWDVSNVSSMVGMFVNVGGFNQDIGGWNVSNVTKMSSMFENAASFNQNIEGWDVSQVTDMWDMFLGARAFNQDIGSWDVSQVIAMDNMFRNASTFNQDLGGWDVSRVTTFPLSGLYGMSEMFSDSGLSNENYDKTLIGWSQLPSLQNDVIFDAPQNQYCDAEEARQQIIDTYGWTIEDADKAADCVAPNDFALRINTGGTETDYNGESFVADTYFNSGNTLDRPQAGLPEPFQTFRFSRSQLLSYDIPVPDGEYTVHLHFAELWFGATGGGSGGVGSRVFDVIMEGQLVQDNLDIFAEVGADAMLIKSHTVTVTGGVLNIDFNSTDAVGGERHPVINAIEILSKVTSTPGLALRGKSANTNTSVLSPNPVISTTSLSFEQPVRLSDIQVFDVSGRLVRTFKATEVSANGVYNLKVHDLESGTYFINATDSQGIKHQKQMVIKK